MKDDEAKYFLASVIESMQDSVITVSLDGTIISWNNAAENLYGYPAKEAIGRSLNMVTFPSDFTALLEKLERIRQGEHMPLFDTFTIDKDGQQLHIEVTLSPVINDHGLVIGVSTVARNVSELRQAQMALETSESKLRAVLEAAIDFAIITVDRQGQIIDWNSGAEIMFGYSREEALGQNTEIIFTPEDRHAHIAQLEIETAGRTGRSIDERWHLHKNGSRFFMSGVMTPISRGQPESYLKVARNITDRKVAEEALMLSEQQQSLALRTAEMGKWDWDMTSNDVKLSEQAALLWGVGIDNGHITFDSLLMQIHPDDKRRVNEQIRSALGGLNIFQSEYRIIRADNKQVKWIIAYGRVIAHENDIPSKMTGVFYDVTPRKLLEQQKEDFISLASHEIKTPLTAIKSYCELLCENIEASGDGDGAVLLRKLNTQVDRLVNLIQNLLDFSNLSEGRMKIYPAELDLNAMVEEQLPALKAISPEHNIKYDSKKVPLVRADHNRISQVLTNFVSNAAKYSPPGTEVIIVLEDRLDKVMLSVKDSGMGIPVEVQQFVFDRYYQAGPDPSNKGFGLGLYICSEIIKQHHGTIGLTSGPGKGSTFYFTLPYT